MDHPSEQVLSVEACSLAHIPALNELIAQSARILSRGFYTEAQTEAAIQYVFGVDSHLVADGTYFLAKLEGQVVGCGGWSRRRTLYGGDQRPMGEIDYLDPQHDAARIRAFFIAPHAARRGVASAIFAACKQAAEAAGFRDLELMATLPGVPFYRVLGFETLEKVEDTLPNGVVLEFERMRLHLASTT